MLTKAASNLIVFYYNSTKSPNSLKQARQFQRGDCDEVYDQDGCNDDDDGWAEDCGFGANNRSLKPNINNNSIIVYVL